MERTFLDKFTIDKISLIYENVGNYLCSGYRRRQLVNTSFTILSNNCWGGHVYRYFGVPYLSPTVGLYFFSDEYIRFLKNWKKYLWAPLKMICAKDSRYAKIIYPSSASVPIGVLNDEIEIVFLHYKSKEEAYEKWNRRLERVDTENIFVKFSEMNLCTEKHIEDFIKLDFTNKLLLLASPRPDIEKGIVVRRYTKNGSITDDTTYFYTHVKLVDWLNKI